MTLTADQTAALAAIDLHIATPAQVAFLLEGGAGVGKTFLLGQLLQKRREGKVVVATPTHKATNVLRRKLDAFGVSWCKGFDPYTYNGIDVITGTTAQLLGIAPVVDENQTDKEVKFGKTGKGILGKTVPSILIIDEVSMLAFPHLLSLIKLGQTSGMKIILVGDAGQLPPVKQQPIPFAKFKHQAALRQIVRQAEGSAIVTLSWAIRENREWQGITGPGVARESDILNAFLEGVQLPGERPEEEREVFIAYRNVVVRDAQDRACQLLYGHAGGAFAPGELVLCETNLYRNRTLLCSNQDELMVDRFEEDRRDPTLGVPVILRHRGRRGQFEAYYLSPEELADKSHPYNVELEARSTQATQLQSKYNAMARTDPARYDCDRARRQAWANFFEWRDQMVISFRHPFAITSHKSQGSTYRTVFAHTGDLAKYSHHALYVAVTRPKEQLVLPA